MLTDQEKAHLRNALQALGDSDAPSRSISDLAKLAEAGMDVSIDFSTQESLGAPVIIAKRRAPTAPVNLTPRQQIVCACLARGMSNKAIAAELSISPATVKDHVHAILARLGLQSRAEIASYIHQQQD